MTTEFIVMLVLGAAAGGFINGLAGTGTALFSLGFYLLVMPPITAIAISSVLAILGGFHGVWAVRNDIAGNSAKVLRFVLPGLLGVPIGVSLLDSVDADALRVAIALLLIVYGGYFSFRSVLPSIERPAPVIDAVVSVVGGILGGLASVSGAVPMMWLSMRPWSKGEIRALLQPFNMVILAATATLLLFKGAYDAVALNGLMIAIPVAMIASLVGIYVFSRLSNAVFRRLLIALTLLTGTTILVQMVT